MSWLGCLFLGAFDKEDGVKQWKNSKLRQELKPADGFPSMTFRSKSSWSEFRTGAETVETGKDPVLESSWEDGERDEHEDGIPSGAVAEPGPPGEEGVGVAVNDPADVRVGNHVHSTFPCNLD